MSAKALDRVSIHNCSLTTVKCISYPEDQSEDVKESIFVTVKDEAPEKIELVVLDEIQGNITCLKLV